MAVLMSREDAKNYIKQQSPRAFLDPDKKGGSVCPFCGNGTGDKGDGLKRIPNLPIYKCFVCDKSADIFDLVGCKFGLSNFNDQFKKAAEIYGVEIKKYKGDGDISEPAGSYTATENITYKKSHIDLTEYITKCHNSVKNTSFYAERGLSDEIVSRFNLGFDASCSKGLQAGETWKAAIIPYSSTSIEIRNTDVSPNDSQNSGNKYRKQGTAVIFNEKVLRTEKDKPIFVCEGAIDALSIIQSGGQAIALGSVSNYKTLLSVLDRITPAKPLMLVLDSDNAGKKTTEKLKKELEEKFIPFMVCDEIVGSFHDANDRLLKDKAGLEKAISDAMAKSHDIKSPHETARDNYLKSSAKNSIAELRSNISKSASRPMLLTGLKGLDDALDGGIYTGLIVVGGISSLGKTTLVLQIADNLAKQGRDVLFFSLEQSKHELMSKSISRETFLQCRANNLDRKNAMSYLGISDGRRWEKYNDTQKSVISNAFDTYEEYSGHIFIYEGIGNITVQQIRNSVKDHISYTGNSRPIVFIDYLQILAANEHDSHATDKQIVDHNITALKQLSRDFDIPIFAVSSLNRENYSSSINMTAFKESGAIEYGSDILIGLQLKGAGEKDFDVDAAKSKDPREVQFCILKNRNGSIRAKGGIDMLFYPVFNYFECVSDKGINTIITTEQEDRIPTDVKPIFDDDKLVFYDVEVFPNLFLVNYKVQGESTVTRLINPTPEQIKDLCTAKLVGFNCRKYDNHLLYGCMQGLDNMGLYNISQKIINKERNAFYREAYNLSYTDVFDFSRKQQSLKKWEIELGIHHQELGLPWDKPVPEDMWNKVAEYCDNDVIATEKVFDHLQGDYKARLILAEISGLTPSDTTNTHTTKIIFGNDSTPQSKFNYRDLSKISGDGMPQFEGYTFTKNADGTVTSMYKGVRVGEGGYIWSAPGIYNNVVTFDVASMHPSSIIAENLFGDEYTKKYAELLEVRLCIKHKEFDKAKGLMGGVIAKYLDDDTLAGELSDALKIAINSVYGLTFTSYENPFKDPRNIDNIVAKRGALFMVNLQEEVKKMGGHIIHIKTDSIKLVNPSKEISDFIISYGKQYGYTFEIEHTFDKICLINDADYVALLGKDDPKHPGEWTATGTKFQDPYVFKRLFTGKDITLDDLSETKSVKSAIYLDMNEKLADGDHDYQFIGKVGQFCPVVPGCGGGILVRDNEKGGYAAVTGTKVKGAKNESYRWLEKENVETFGLEKSIDLRLFEDKVKDAIDSISTYGDAQSFIPFYENNA